MAILFANLSPVHADRQPSDFGTRLANGLLTNASKQRDIRRHRDRRRSQVFRSVEPFPERGNTRRYGRSNTGPTTPDSAQTLRGVPRCGLRRVITATTGRGPRSASAPTARSPSGPLPRTTATTTSRAPGTGARTPACGFLRDLTELVGARPEGGWGPRTGWLFETGLTFAVVFTIRDSRIAVGREYATRKGALEAAGGCWTSPESVGTRRFGFSDRVPPPSPGPPVSKLFGLADR